jgi:hypothetical protein
MIHNSRIDKSKYLYVRYPNAGSAFFKNNQFHRERDLPAVIWDNGNMVWYIDGTAIKNNYKNSNL